MHLKNIIRKVVFEHHNKKILKESLNLLNEEPKLVDPSKYTNIDFKDGVVGNSKPSKDKINPSLLSDVDIAAGIAGTKASITTAVSGHDTGTRHEAGLAVDVAMFDGKGYGSKEDAKKKGIYDKIERFVRALESMGYKINSERGNDKAVLWFGFKNHDHHVHISRRSDDGSSSPEKPVEKGKTKEYLKYGLNSGKIYNPTKVKITGVGVLSTKKGDETIYGIKRKSDDRVFLFAFDNNIDTLYIEMSLDDFKTKKESRINGTWEKLTESSVIRDPKSKNQEKSSETTNKEKSKDDKTTNNVMFVGDSLSSGKGTTWNYLLEKDHPNWNVTHVTKGGMKTDWMLNNMLPKLEEKKYDKVFIYGGTNDAFWVGTKLSNAVSNIQKMVDAVKKQGGKAYVFLGYDANSVMTDKNLKPTKYCNQNCMKKGRERMIQLQNDLSSQISGAKIIPTVNGDGTWAAGDGIHVGPAQHKIMKNHVEKYI
jgi:lysophospholipase L1-like esterase